MARKIWIRFEIDPKSLKDLNRLAKKIPESVDAGVRDGMELIKADLQNEIMMRELIWSTTLLKSVEVVPGEPGSYWVGVAEHGDYLNRAPETGHFVSLKRGRKITRWAAEHGMAETPWTRYGGAMYVLGPTQAFRYGGWIESGTARAEERLETALLQRLNEV